MTRQSLAPEKQHRFVDLAVVVVVAAFVVAILDCMEASESCDT